MSKLKRILFLSYRMSDGGTERAVSYFTDALAELGYDVGLFIYEKSENEYCINPKVKIFRYNGLAKGRIGTVYQRNVQIRQVIGEFKPDCCLPFLPGVIEDTYFASVKFNIPVVAAVRNKPRDMGKIKQIISDYVFRHCAAVFFQTEEQKAFFPEAIARKGFVVPNSVPDELLQYTVPASGKITRFVSVGRLNKQKNQIMLIDAFSDAVKRIPGLTLDIYGAGEEKDNLLNEIDANSLHGTVRLCGRTENIAETLSKYDAFLFSSDYEGMPNALMEAMAFGLPCVSTDCPTGPAELLGNNERGILVPVNNRDAMAEAIAELSVHPSEALEKAAAAKQYIRNNFNKQAIAQRLANALESII